MHTSEIASAFQPPTNRSDLLAVSIKDVRVLSKEVSHRYQTPYGLQINSNTTCIYFFGLILIKKDDISAILILCIIISLRCTSRTRCLLSVPLCNFQSVRQSFEVILFAKFIVCHVLFFKEYRLALID